MQAKLFPVLTFSLFLLAGLTACTDPEASKARYLKEGQELLDQGDYERARISFKNVLQVDPKDPKGHYWMALTYEKLGQLNQTVAHLRAAIQEDPDYNDAKYKLARIYLGARLYDEAGKLIGEVLASQPERVDALVLRAAIHASKGEKDQARADLDQVLKLKPQDPEGLRVMAALDWQDGNKDQAIERLRKGLAAHPDDVSLQVTLAEFLMASGHAEEALPIYRHLIEQQSDQLAHRVRLAQALISLKKADEAEAVLRNAVETMEDNMPAIKALLEFKAKTQGVEAVLAELDKLIAQYPEEAELRFMQTGIYLRQKKPDKARAALEEIVEHFQGEPDALKAKNMLAELALMSNDMKRARRLIGEVLEKSPQDATALTLRGRMTLMEDGSADSAIADFRAALVSRPKDLQLLQFLAGAHLRKGEMDLAQETLAKAAELAPDDPAIHLRLAGLMKQRKMDDAAIKQLDQFLQRKFDLKVAMQLFRWQMERKNYRQAEQLAQRIAREMPKQGTGDYLLGVVAQARQQWDKSLDLFEQALEKQPKALEPLQGLVQSYMAMKQPDKARQRILAMLKANPDHFPAQYLLGEVLWNQGNKSEAMAAWQKAISMKPDWPLPYQRLAKVYLEKGEIEKAVDQYRKALEADPENQQRYLDLALLLQSLGKADEAMAVYDRGLEKFPESLILKNNLASLLLDYHHDKAGLAKAERLAEALENSRNPAFLDTLAWLRYRQGRSMEAREYIDRAVAKAGDQPVLLYHQAQILAQLNDTGEACASLEKAIQLNARYAEIEEVKELQQQCPRQTGQAESDAP